MTRHALTLVCVLITCGSVCAHPVPKDQHDRTIVLHVTPGALLVDYRLEVDVYRANKDLEGVDLGRIRTPEDFCNRYLRELGPGLMGNLVAQFDGKELTFTCIEQSARLLDHVRCDYRFRARWTLTGSGKHAFTFRDTNFHTDIVSAIHLSLAGSPELTLSEVVTPDDDLLSRPTDQLDSRQRDRLRRASAVLRAIPSVQAGIVRPALPPDPDPIRPPARGRARRLAAVSKSVPSHTVALARPLPPDAPADHAHHLLALLFDTRQGIGILLLLAAAFGAVHALTPGHGKTMVAAYLVGERGTVWHALVLGLVTTLTHTSAVLLLALLLPWFFPDAVPRTVQSILGLVGGLLIAGLGSWLLLQRLSGRADHVHLGGGHHHTGGSAPGWGGLVLLGISGGIVPCWDAIAMLGLAISTQRLWLGVPLLLAFSAGLAGVLVALGIAVVRARNLIEPGERGDRFRLVLRALPVVSAVVITCLGLWLCYESARLAS